MSTVPDEKGLNTQTVGAGGQGQITKEESGAVPNLTEFAPLIVFTTGSFERLNTLMAQILSDFLDKIRAKLEMQKTQEERLETTLVASLLESIDELRIVLINLIWREYNESFFNNPANVKWFAKIVTKLAAAFNDFEAGKIGYANLINILSNIRSELRGFLYKAVGTK
jgi:hypothetical protein